ncbi:hypothetical protein E2F43_04275 [Seongchinamella unica]|uniref:Uncharacterized protein n=1 Tax=Seongchinamella unica TaxID=2547392 RepID=A0A4R5LVH9_9GAMM|nr:AsmA-like C-terminal region-containing protein [Seongchinamella unica]TDG15454.1 hypothetical protein E2F43_04275 [Seongchinamella unica]
MKKAAIGLLCLLLVLGVAMAVAVNRLLQDTAMLENVLSNTLEREVRIGKLRELSLGVSSTVLIEDLTIANPAWAPDPYLLQLSRARVHLHVPSLWGDGPVVISDLTLVGLRLALSEAEENPPNWQFAEPAAESGDLGRESLTLPLLLKQAHVSDSVVTYEAPGAEIQANLSGQLTGGRGLLLEVGGHWQKQPLQFTGHTSYEGGGLSLSGMGEYRGWQLNADGTLADPLAFRGLDFQLELQGQLPMPPSRQQPARQLPLHLDVHLGGSGRSLSLSRGLLVSGESQLTLNGEIGNPATLRGLDLDLVFDSPDIKPLLPLEAASDRPVQAALEGRLRSDGKMLRLEKIVGRSGGVRLQGDLVLPLAGGLKGTEISLFAHGDSVAEALSPWTGDGAEDAPFELDVEGHWRDPVWHVEKLHLQLGSNRLEAVLALMPEEGGTAATGQVNLSGRRAHRALEALGFHVRLPDDAYLLRTELARSAEGELRLSDLDLQLGGSDLAGQFYYRPGEPAQLQAELTAKTLDMRFLSRSFDREVEQAGPGAGKRPFDASTPLSKAQLAERMIPATSLDFRWLKNYEGKFSLVVEELIARDDLRSQGDFSFTLAEGKLVSESLQWGGGFSSGEASLVLEHLDAGAAVNLQMQSHRLPLFWLFTGDPTAEQQSNYRATIAARGASVRELATSLNGTVYLRGGGGRINNQGLNLFFGDVIGEIFASINPMSQQEPYTQVECHSGIIVFEDGLATLDPGMVMRTDKVDIALGGTVDLDTEGLDLVFNTRSRTGVGISASKALTPYLKLEGNFSYPRLGVNAKGVVISGGAAFATGGLSILAEGMWDRWIATSANPCEALFDESKKAESEFKKLFGRPL